MERSSEWSTGRESFHAVVEFLVLLSALFLYTQVIVGLFLDGGLLLFLFRVFCINALWDAALASLQISKSTMTNFPMCKFLGMTVPGVCAHLPYTFSERDFVAVEHRLMSTRFLHFTAAAEPTNGIRLLFSDLLIAAATFFMLSLAKLSQSGTVGKYLVDLRIPKPRTPASPVPVNLARVSS